MINDMEERYPDYKFFDTFYGASLGIRWEDVDKVYLRFTKFSLEDIGDKRGVADLVWINHSAKPVRSVLFVFLTEDEVTEDEVEEKNLQVYVHKKGGWEGWGGRIVKQDIGTWKGYIVVEDKVVGDPPIAVGK
jgi:hypothetical protein